MSYNMHGHIHLSLSLFIIYIYIHICAATTAMFSAESSVYYVTMYYTTDVLYFTDSSV